MVCTSQQRLMRATGPHTTHAVGLALAEFNADPFPKLDYHNLDFSFMEALMASTFCGWGDTLKIMSASFKRCEVTLVDFLYVHCGSSIPLPLKISQ